MSEMFNLNFIGAAYNRFGKSLQRIYNNNNEIIWELNDGSDDYLWVAPDPSMLVDGNNYIGFFKVNSTSDTTLPENSIQYSLDGINWEYMPAVPTAAYNEIEITQKTYFRFVYGGFIRHRIYGRHATSSSGWNNFLCNVGGSLHKYMGGIYYNEVMFGRNPGDPYAYPVQIPDTGTPFFRGLKIVDASKLHVDYYQNDHIIPYGYAYMFDNQSFMTKPPIINIEKVEDSGCFVMFAGCSSLESAPTLPATDLGNNCYDSMFKNCTSLVNAPELPATTLYQMCYYEMFKGCTSLRRSPKLMASQLVNGCYDSMFYGCTALSYIYCFAKNPTVGLTNWVYNVHSTGEFTKLKDIEWPTGVNGIPENWFVHTQQNPY